MPSLTDCYTEPDLTPDPKPESEPDPNANAVTDTVANLDPDPEPDTTANAVTYTEFDLSSDPKPDSEPDPDHHDPMNKKTCIHTTRSAVMVAAVLSSALPARLFRMACVCLGAQPAAGAPGTAGRVSGK